MALKPMQSYTNIFNPPVADPAHVVGYKNLEVRNQQKWRLATAGVMLMLCRS